MPAHELIAGTDIHDLFRYRQAADPGAVGADANWLDTTDPIAPVWRRRNAANTAWTVMNAAVAGSAVVAVSTASVALTNAGNTLSAAAVTGTGSGVAATGNHAHPATPTPLQARRHLFLVDDFGGPAIESGEVGALHWASFQAGVADAAGANHPGLVRLLTGTTQYSEGYVFLAETKGSLVASERFDLTWVFRSSTADSADAYFSCGLLDALNAYVHGAYFEKSTAATTIYARTRGSGGATQSVYAGAWASNAWYRARIRRISATQIGFTLNAGAELVVTATLPTADVRPFALIGTNNTVQRSMDLDLFSLSVTGL